MRATAHNPGKRSVAGTTLAALATCALALLLSPAAVSAAPPQLWQKCDADEPAGQRCGGAPSIVANHDNGHVFVADSSNSRIVEFTAVGEFVKTWGWDVVGSGPGDDTIAPEDEFEVCVPEDGDTCKAGIAGTGAGQFGGPAGLALDSAGNVYVVDSGNPSNNRVQKFSRKGEFLAAWGGDVVFSGPEDSSSDEQQQLTVAASAGSFRLGLPSILSNGEREETAPIPFNASAAAVQAALNALPSIGGIGGSVSVSGGPGDASGSSPYLVTFEGNLGGDDVAQLSVALGVGSALKCSSPTAAEAISYQWLRNDSKIAGATSSTYTATAADEGKAIQCQVTATNVNAGSTQVANPAQVIAPAPRRPGPSHPGTIAAPEASAPLSVGSGGGQTLSCDADKAGWKELAGIFTYRWYRNGVQIGSAESSTYKVTAADLANPAVFQCQVTAHGFGSSDLSVTKVSESRATEPPPSAPLPPEAQASTSPGNGVITVADGGGPEICKPADTCKGGTEGTANGEFGDWAVGSFIAITPTDKVYVGDENRIQRFDTEGVYQGEIALPGKTVRSLATDAAGNLYVAYGVDNLVHKLSPSGEPLSPVFELPTGGSTGGGAPAIPTAVAVDAADHVYAFGPTFVPGAGGALRNPIDEFDPAGNLIDSFGKGEFGGSTGLATNLCAGSEAPGNLFVGNFGSSSSGTEDFLRAYGTQPNGCFKALTGAATGVEETAATLNGTVNPSGSLSSECRFQYGTTTAYETTVPCAESSAQIGEGTSPVPVHLDLSNLQAGTVYHYRLRAIVNAAIEKGPDRSFKTLGPPVISHDHVAGATDTEATLRALVNPEGFPTTYRFQYVDQDAFEAEGFANPLASAETAVGSDRSDHPVTVTLGDLAPGTTYRWRILATNSSGLTEGEEHILATYPTFAPETDCPNQALRIGASAFLPDCRAYEMVSPVDKNGGDIFRESSGVGDPGGYVQAAPDGDSITYTALAAFADPPNSFNFNQYLAVRQAQGGWSNQGIHPPVAGQAVDTAVFGFTREFMVFSPDLCSAWLVDYQTPAPTAEGQEGYRNLYRRDNCGADAGSLEALIPNPPYELPPGTPPNYADRDSVQGYSEDSRHTIFAAFAKLTADAAAGPGPQLYDLFGGELALVSVLPGGVAASGAGMTMVGSGSNSNLLNLDNAVSADGSRVYWTTSKLYLRLHPEQGTVSGECSKPTKACTVAVSAGGGAVFWTATADGSKALYSEGEDLYEFDLERYEAEEPPRRLIASNVEGVAGASEDLARIYLVSTDALPGAGPNSIGDEAVAGEPNLYLEEEGATSFVGTLLAGDIGAKEPGATVTAYDLVHKPGQRATRVSADGARIAFQSRAPLTGYDNAAEDGRPAVEVFTYEAGGALACVSCNPSGARPSGVRELRQPYEPPWSGNPTKVPAGAWIPSWEHELHASNVLSADGSRLFFNANDALLPRDTNGAQDVYEWEAPGTGGCTEASPSYFAQNGGCLHLISSGESSYESEFWEASPDGSDVFFTTESSLLPQDPGSIDLYDARAGGGFPQPIGGGACEGEACQSPPPPPNDPTPASSAFRGPGNLSQGPPGRCRKGKVRRRGRCVRKHRKRANSARKRRANHDRRAPR